MKKFSIYTVLIALIFAGCDDQVFPDLENSAPILVVDAWLNDLPEEQVIRLTMSQPYFENTDPTGVTNAEVFILDRDNNRFDFTNIGDGAYTHDPGAAGFGELEMDYTLHVNVGSDSFYATSRKNDVPPVDSVTFEWEDKSFRNPEEIYIAQFWSRDLLGPGDTYWIKSYKNEKFLSKPEEINIAYDAGFSAGGNIDNLIFIPPIRNRINPQDEDSEDNLISPFADGDSVYVEIHSITEAAFNFLTNVKEQTDRPGGFAELFARPLSNVNGNIVNANSSSEVFALGFFCVSSVKGNGARLDTSQVPKEP